jgi:hypothetical protein
MAGGYARDRRWGVSSSPISTRVLPILLLAAALFGALSHFLPRRAWADGRACAGPPACCPATVASELPGLPAPVDVAIGVTLVGLYNINEKAGTWDADYYLHETWPPTPDFTPQTEVVNEVSRQSQQFDETELRRGRCVRSRRVHSTLHSLYDLRTFPFDRQQLTLVLSDAAFTDGEARYADRPASTEIDDGARGQLAGWSFAENLSFTHAPRAFKGDDGAPLYDYATFSLPVRRLVSFHLTKFFLPLFVIVAVAFSALWIDPDDLGSRAGIGVTCLLAAIAFQLAEAGSLPAVPYLTLADRVYAICYFALAFTILASVVASRLAREKRKDRALLLDRRARRLFPAALLVALTVGVLRSIILSRT